MLTNDRSLVRQEMYTSYLERVDRWTRDASAQEWTKAYDKESYPRAYACVCW